MKVVNPLNKTPLPPETMVNSGCHCYCFVTSDSATYAGGWNPLTDRCNCSCDDRLDTKQANYGSAWTQAYP